jgi:5-methylthioadenosine/S-adenosylhomocysteine deaminase
MPPESGLEMATVNGARAALLDARIGSLEAGKEADIVLFDTGRPEWQPLINPVANLVYSATGDSVRDVFVMGEQVVADGHLTRIDEAKLFAEVPTAVGRLRKHLKFENMVTLKWPVE